MSEKNLKDVLVDGQDLYISLSKLTGKGIKDIQGYVSGFTPGDALFMLTDIVFDDDTKVRVEGEHDFPYLVEYKDGSHNLDSETLERFDEELSHAET